MARDEIGARPLGFLISDITQPGLGAVKRGGPHAFSKPASSPQEGSGQILEKVDLAPGHLLPDFGKEKSPPVSIALDQPFSKLTGTSMPCSLSSA
jgi:hypothetical protein